jgi:hypothetical protein
MEISLQGPILILAKIQLLYYVLCLLPATHPRPKYLYYLVNNLYLLYIHHSKVILIIIPSLANYMNITVPLA